MLLPLAGRRIAYDLVGPGDASEDAPTICITHSLASDGGSWAEQVPALLQGGFRVLRIDMRGHGGSDPVAGDYTMAALADDVAQVLSALAIPRVHYIGLSIGGMIGQAFALAHGDRLISALWCDTLPASPQGARDVWDQRINTVRAANSLEKLAEPTVERWLTDDFKARHPGRWRQIRDTVVGTTPGRVSRLLRRDPRFRFRAAPAGGARAGAGRLRRRRRRHAAGREPPARRAGAGGALRGDGRLPAFPECRAPGRIQPHHDGLARGAQTRAVGH